MRIVKALLGSALLTGCAAQQSELVCSGGDVRFRERARMEVYFTSGDVHGNNLAVLSDCPDTVLLIRAGMPDSNARRALWDRVNAIEPLRGQIPTGRAIVSGVVELSQDGRTTLEIYDAEQVEQAYPPQNIATTLLPLSAGDTQ